MSAITGADHEPVAAGLAALAEEASRLKTASSRSSQWLASVCARAPDQIDPRFHENVLGHFASGIRVITAMSPDDPVGDRPFPHETVPVARALPGSPPRAVYAETVFAAAIVARQGRQSPLDC